MSGEVQVKTKYKPYPKYIESGVEWLGKVPKHWNLSKFKYSTFINKNNLSENTSEETVIKYIDIGNVDSNGNILEIQEMNFGIAPSRARRVVTNGDTLISTVRTYLKAITFIDKTDNNLICSTGFAVLTPTSDYYPRYLAYLLRSTQYIENIVANSAGVSYPAINSSDIGDMICILPSIQEQTQIAKFLDRETAIIDSLIEKKQRLIELLDEKRQAIISQAVTKGLNPNVKMKESRIEWLGEVPEHWEVKRLNYVISNIGSGTTPNSTDESYYDGDIPWIITGDLKDDYILRSTKNITEKAIRDYSTLKVYPKGSLIIAMYGATIGKLGILTFPATTNQACCILPPSNKTHIKFLYYWFLCMREHIISLALGGGQPNISQDIIKNLRLALSTLKEQLQIVEYLDDKLIKITELKTKLNQQITKLQEYRQALISAAVTGKIDIREEVTS